VVGVSEPEVFSAALTLSGVDLELVRNLRAFGQAGESGALYRADVNEHVTAAIIRLNEAVAFGRVEPFHSTGRHAINRGTIKMSRGKAASGKGGQPTEKNIGTSWTPQRPTHTTQTRLQDPFRLRAVTRLGAVFLRRSSHGNERFDVGCPASFLDYGIHASGVLT
jgi:ribosomal protein L11 methylase PrmA